MDDKKLSALIAITAIVIVGQLLVSFSSASDIVRYLVSDIGTILVTFMAAYIGFKQAKAFTFKSAFGKSLAFISLGVFFWGLGEAVWMYYNTMANIEMPYPSLADAGFVGMIPFAALGLFLLLKSIRMQFDAKTILKMLLLPALSFLLTYKLFIQTKLAEDVPMLMKILNVAYPVGDAIFLSFALVILSTVKGGKLFKPIGILCAGFIIEAIADLSFSWTSSAGTYLVAGWVDMLFVLAFFVIGLGMHYMKDLLDVKQPDKRYNTR